MPALNTAGVNGAAVNGPSTGSDAGSIATATATPLTATEQIVAADPGSITAAVATPLDHDRRSWALQGQSITVSDATLTPTTISIQFYSDRSDLADWRIYDRAGDTTQETGFGGAFRTVDRAGRSGTVAVEPPADSSPPFDSVAGYVQGYGESQSAPDRAQISMTVARQANRGDVFDQVSGSGIYEFGTQRGTVGLPSGAVAQQERSGTTTAGETQLTLRLTAAEAAAIADAWSHPRGVSEETVSDGANQLVDDSPSKRQTVTVSTPADAQLTDGTYYATGWSLSRDGYSGRPWRVSVTLASD